MDYDYVDPGYYPGVEATCRVCGRTERIPDTVIRPLFHICDYCSLLVILRPQTAAAMMQARGG